MASINIIKEKIADLYKKNPNIQISINTTHPKTVIENASAVIRGVYPNIFRLEETDRPKVFHTVPYSDILCGRVKITGLEF